MHSCIICICSNVDLLLPTSVTFTAALFIGERLLRLRQFLPLLHILPTTIITITIINNPPSKKQWPLLPFRFDLFPLS